MKFARLYLKAFGPFSERVLQFAARDGRDLQLVYGPNEAGKSSTLRAVTSLLFGVPERTPDNFVHDYPDLRVGALLRLPDGATLGVMRRKARKHTLFALDETSGAERTATPLDEDTLARLLGGLDQALYRTLFGLDLEGLHAGSEELLRGEGEVGRSLFQAAAGLAGLRGLMAGLEQAAADTFKVRGSTTPLNRALQDFAAQRQVLKDSTVRSAAWDNVEREHRRARDTHLALRATLAASVAARQGLERLRFNLPLLAERAELQSEIEALGAVPTLAADATERRVAAEVELRGARAVLAASGAALAKLEGDRAACVVRDALLTHAARIEEAYHAVGGYRRARSTLPELRRRQVELDTRVGQLLGELDAAGETDPERLLPGEVLRAAVLAALEEDAELRQRERHLAGDLDQRHDALARTEAGLAQLPAAPPPDAMDSALAQIGALVDLEARVRELDREVEELATRLASEVAALWPGTLAELLALTVPLPAVTQEFELAFAEQARQAHSLGERDLDLAGELAELRRELEALAASGEVVTQGEVAAARVARDVRWREVRAALDAESPVPASLAPEFEAALREADRLADLLHADTARATRVTDARERIRALERDAEQLRERRAALTRAGAELAVRWRTLVAPLRRDELTPAALREWLVAHARVRERHAEQHKLAALQRDATADLARACAALEQLLHACSLAARGAGESLAEALARAQRAVSVVRNTHAEGRRLSEQRDEICRDLARLDAERQRQASQRAAWRGRWREQAAVLRLGPQARPAEVKVRLEQFARLAAALDEHARLAADQEAQRAVVAGFEVGLADLAGAVGEPVHERGADALAEVLYAELAQARQSFARRQTIVTEIEAAQRMRADAQQVAQSAELALADLQRQAGAATVDELPAIETRAARRRDAEKRLADIERDLRDRNARPVAEVSAEAAGQTLDDLAARSTDTEASIDALEHDVDVAREALFEARRALEAIDGGGGAAEAEQALRSLAARIVGEARSYARLRLAHALLGRVVQRYRDQHQGPLLARAKDIFRRITLGSFPDLVVDYEDDRQVLLGLRDDGRRVAVAGMSHGTRDQLFLALRIAAIEQHIASRGPFPVIVDDLLVQFDDARALATLAVLAELATRTQVLFFTHHLHLLTLVESSSLAGEVAVQRL